MNICYYYQDLLPWPVRGLSTTRFNPTRVSALLVYSMIAQVCLLGTLYQGLGLVWLHRLNLVHFQGYPIRLVSPAVNMGQHLLTGGCRCFREPNQA
jgi:hypothetical protein